MFKRITEGLTSLHVPVEGGFGKRRSGRPRKPPVFYNPHMQLARDVCVLFLKAVEASSFADVLAGSGVKGLRAAVEAGCKVYLNDANPAAAELAERNAELNKVDARVLNMDGGSFLLSHKGVFDFIDIDPFGSPAPFLSPAFLAVRRKGFIGMTATDTATLCGVYPRTCYRRYGAMPLRSPFCHEVGLRILIGHAVREAARYDRAAQPVLSHSTRHYFRLYLHVVRSAPSAQSALEKLGYLYWCGSCLAFDYEQSLFPAEKTCSCSKGMSVHGPLWLGRLHDKAVVSSMLELASNGAAVKLLKLIQGEVEAPFYHDLHALARRAGLTPPKVQAAIGRLRERGHMASRTHFSPVAVKTDAGAKDVMEVFGSKA